MSLSITVRRHEDVTILDLRGKVSLGPDNDALSNALQDWIAKGARKLLLNMAGVTQMDTSGISTLVRGFVTMQRHDGRLAVTGLPDRIRMLLEMTRLLNVIPDYPNEAEALARLRA